jgi:cell division protease FtsH
LSLKNALSNAIETNEDSHILVFDEFQLSRTINEQGLEVDKSSARVIWDAIDHGAIELYKKSSTTRDFIRCNQYITDFLDKGIRTKNNHVIDEDMQIVSMLASNVFSVRENFDVETYRYIIPRNYFYVFNEQEYVKYEGVFYFTSYEKLINKTEKMSVKELLDWFDKFLDLHFKPQVIDLKKSLIFILGNLDEAYGISGYTNPDADADLYHEHTLSITNSKIKDALLTRFRPEQVSRLGNNYVIYPSLNKKSYQKLIKIHLNRVKKMCKKEFEMNIIFDKSIE